MLKGTSQRLLISLISSLTLLFGNPAHSSVLDQENLIDLNAGAVVFNGSSVHYWQQEVISGMSGTLARVDFVSSTEDAQFEFLINRGSPWQSDTNDFFGIVDLKSSMAGSYCPGCALWWYSIDVSGANINLQAGDQFVIGFHGLGDAQNLYGTYEDDYSGLLKYLVRYPDQDLGPYDFPVYDLAFRTYMIGDDGSVPEPASVVLLGLGLAGLASIRRKQKTA